MNEIPLPHSHRTAPPDIEVVVPVYNEEHVLEANVRRLHAYLGNGFPDSAAITIVDNASSDGTFDVAHALATEARRRDRHAPAREGPRRARCAPRGWAATRRGRLHGRRPLDGPGRPAQPLVAPLLVRATATSRRHAADHGAHVVRVAQREVISRSYNRARCRTLLRSRFSDAQCGFKAGRREACAPSSRS